MWQAVKFNIITQFFNHSATREFFIGQEEQRGPTGRGAAAGDGEKDGGRMRARERGNWRSSSPSSFALIPPSSLFSLHAAAGNFSSLPSPETNSGVPFQLLIRIHQRRSLRPFEGSLANAARITMTKRGERAEQAGGRRDSSLLGL